MAVRPSDAGVAAFHLERAERFPEAIAAHVDAARADQRLGAHKEATQRLTHALDADRAAAGGAGAAVSELTVRQLRAFSAMMAGGYSTRESREDHARCVELCEELGLGPELVPSLMVAGRYYCSCDLARPSGCARRLERLAARARLPARELGPRRGRVLPRPLRGGRG